MEYTHPLTVFVTGATGTLGRPVVQRLVAAGYHVRGLSRSAQNTALLEGLGAEPVSADLFDARALSAALTGCDAVLHLATKIPPTTQVGRPSAWGENDHLRREGARAIVASARSAGVGAIIYPSYAFVYPDSGADWIDATTTPADPPSIPAGSTMDAETAVAEFAAAGGGRGISLRLGSLYSPYSPSARDMLQMARLGIAPLPGRLEAYFPSLWVDDAADALIAALVTSLAGSLPSGVYDVVDDQPLPRRTLFAALARAAGRRRLRRLPDWLWRVMGGAPAELLGRSLRVSNRRFKEATGWAPTVRSATDGWELVAEELTHLDATSRTGLLAGSRADGGRSQAAPMTP